MCSGLGRCRSCGAVLFIWSRTPIGKLQISALILKIPLAESLAVQLSVAQATRSLATLLAGGITLVESWEIARSRLRTSNCGVAVGDSADDSRRTVVYRKPGVGGWMPALAVDMIGIGERSGSLREMLDEVAVFYDAESEVRLEQLTTTLEPAILVVMGGVVVTILLAIYLPIIQSISAGSGSHRGGPPLMAKRKVVMKQVTETR
jgi:type IV pilus assembly protein PilC